MAQEIADSTLLDTWASSGLIVEPDASKIIEGWRLGEQPPHEYMNWLQNTFGSKLNHILKNGVASWNNETQYLAGSSVQHNGNVWLCKATNTNSAPTDVNANWKRIITSDLSGETSKATPVDADLIPISDSAASFGLKKLSWANLKATLKHYLDTLYVALSGNQTIAGNKSFTGNLLVTADTGAFGYDTGAGGTVTQLTSKSTAVTLNKPSGQIIMHNAPLSAGASVTFAVNNSLINTIDTPICVFRGPTSDIGAKYDLDICTVTEGFFITIKNKTTGSLSESIRIGFSGIKGATS